MSAHKAGATTLTQGSENFGYSRVRLRRIAKLQFGVINPNELVRISFRLWRKAAAAAVAAFIDVLLSFGRERLPVLLTFTLCRDLSHIKKIMLYSANIP